MSTRWRSYVRVSSLKMAVILTEDICLLGLTSLIACYQMAMFAQKVGGSRMKHKIEPPATDGNEAFVRIFRAQQNGIEFFGIFIVMMWASGIFFHQIPASLLGLIYCYGRQKYFDGYSRNAKERLPGFYLCVKTLQAFLLVTAIGVAQTILATYFGINAKKALMGLIL